MFVTNFYLFMINKLKRKREGVVIVANKTKGEAGTTKLIEMGDEQGREKRGNEVKKPEEGQSEEPVVRDDKNKGEAKDLLPPPPSQEVVLRAIMHCEECARGVKQRLRHFEDRDFFSVRLEFVN
ncbi:hypothetical protein E3N88_40611 [Mikania micrantha]|uniref:HMA domain-containing protein n=1 Tax=Mikania micrantha TaxID=192012 RepID=A0A5N6LN87_9ASTR|nr:hypothetical protein E3N88_40611 [Mikania micrantha]